MTEPAPWSENCVHVATQPSNRPPPPPTSPRAWGGPSARPAGRSVLSSCSLCVVRVPSLVVNGRAGASHQFIKGRGSGARAEPVRAAPG